MAEQALSKDVVTNPVKLDKVLRAAGEALIFDGRGHSVVDFGLALQEHAPGNTIPMIKLPGRLGDRQRQSYQRRGAASTAAEEFFASVRDGTVATFLLEQPGVRSTTA